MVEVRLGIYENNEESYANKDGRALPPFLKTKHGDNCPFRFHFAFLKISTQLNHYPVCDIYYECVHDSENALFDCKDIIDLIFPDITKDIGKSITVTVDGLISDSKQRFKDVERVFTGYIGGFSVCNFDGIDFGDDESSQLYKSNVLNSIVNKYFFKLISKRVYVKMSVYSLLQRLEMDYTGGGFFSIYKDKNNVCVEYVAALLERLKLTKVYDDIYVKSTNKNPILKDVVRREKQKGIVGFTGDDLLYKKVNDYFHRRMPPYKNTFELLVDFLEYCGIDMYAPSVPNVRIPEKDSSRDNYLVELIPPHLNSKQVVTSYAQEAYKSFGNEFTDHAPFMFITKQYNFSFSSSMNYVSDIATYTTNPRYGSSMTNNNPNIIGRESSLFSNLMTVQATSLPKGCKNIVPYSAGVYSAFGGNVTANTNAFYSRHRKDRTRLHAWFTGHAQNINGNLSQIGSMNISGHASTKCHSLARQIFHDHVKYLVFSEGVYKNSSKIQTTVSEMIQEPFKAKDGSFEVSLDEIFLINSTTFYMGCLSDWTKGFMFVLSGTGV